MTRLPRPLDPAGPYRVAMVCLGNICRSPMAEVVLVDLLCSSGLDQHVLVASSGTAGWHVGKPMDPRSAATLEDEALDPSGHRAKQFHAAGHDSFDLVVAMDRDNLAGVGGRSDRAVLLRDFDPLDPGAEVPDPYYGGDDGFREVYAMIERSCAELVRELAAVLRPDSSASDTR